MPTDTSERSLERLICTALAGHPCEPPASGTMAEPAAGYGGVGWSGGNPHDYDREYCVDGVQLGAFLRATQPEIAEAIGMASTGAGATHASPLPDQDGPTLRKFLARLQGEVSKRGTIDVLRHGLKHGPHHLDLFYGTPSPGNEAARERFEHNRFTVSRQLRYSRDEAQRAPDIGLFINGLPVFTFELKNSLTKQTADDAVQQYRRDRNWRERLFEFGRCVAHFAVDDGEVRFCTRLQGKASWFLPFNRGWNDGAGNPPNPSGIKTDYLWRRVLSRGSLTDVLWLARQLIDLKRDDAPVFDSIIVVTDRRILDRQIHDTIRQFSQVSATVGHADRSGDLRRFIESGKKIIISTVQKFPFILKAVQTLSRLNRAHPQKHDVFVMDFLNDADTIRDAFADFYRTTILADETDPDKLHDLQAELDGAQVYAPEQVDELVACYLGGADRDRLDPILDACVAVYLNDLDEDGQVAFKGNAKGFVRTYAFLSAVLPYTNAAWEKRSIFLNFLIPKLPAPQIEHDKALLRVMTSLMKDDTELFRQFMDNAGFKRWLTDTVFTLAYEQTDVA